MSRTPPRESNAPHGMRRTHADITAQTVAAHIDLSSACFAGSVTHTHRLSRAWARHQSGVCVVGSETWIRTLVCELSRL
eukprot:1610034-Rhodomonas_salina.1